ncbi:MAG: THUMP domain-containing class I SAM-dependent RNA methyltransferase [Anaerovoracaceae bacterium]
MKRELIATATFGLEAVVKREVQNLGYEILKTEDGKVTFAGDDKAIVRTNLWLRSADRVLLKMAEFEAYEFEELFQGVIKIPWEKLIPIDGRFDVTGSSVKSKLFSVPSCQAIVKKAIVERLRGIYGVDRFEETGGKYTVKVTLLRDKVTITVDSSGVGLHKRGYRVKDVIAPIKETLAAALVQLSFWRDGRVLVDPLCGSGTIPIEAAMIGRNIAPGLKRNFAAETWNCIDKSLWEEERKLAKESIKSSAEMLYGWKNHSLNSKNLEKNNLNEFCIFGYDINKMAIEACKENAKAAGVDADISFRVQDVSKLDRVADEGIIVTNPPYGERIGDMKEIEIVYNSIKKFCAENPDWSLFLITADTENIEQNVLLRPADRRRKLYNGRIETCYYQFHGLRKK